MFFRQILHEEKACTSYIIGCPTKGVSIVIDPQGDPQHYINISEGNAMAIQGVIETHLHADHISSARELSSLKKVPHYLGPGADVQYDYTSLSDGQVLEAGNRKIKIMHTPGHTPEHICLLIDDWFVLTGDTLFVGDVGRVDLALNGIDVKVVSERANQLYFSLQRLLELPDWTEIYAGHYSGSVCGRGIDGKPISTIGRERIKNKALRLSKEEFAEFQTKDIPPLPEGFHSIKMKNIGYE